MSRAQPPIKLPPVAPERQASFAFVGPPGDLGALVVKIAAHAVTSILDFTAHAPRIRYTYREGDDREAHSLLVLSPTTEELEAFMAHGSGPQDLRNVLILLDTAAEPNPGDSTLSVALARAYGDERWPAYVVTDSRPSQIRDAAGGIALRALYGATDAELREMIAKENQP